MNKIKNMEKHLRRYVLLAIIFFALELLLQSVLLLNGWNITIGQVVVPSIVNYEAALISIAMIFMGVYYLKK